MSDPSFFQEIQEDLERQKLEALWKKYGFWIIVLALGLVIATASATTFRSWKASHNQKVTAAFLTTMRASPTAAETLKALNTFADEHRGADQAAMALLRAGSVALAQGDVQTAVGFFDRVEKDAGFDSALRQLGALFSVQAQLDQEDPALLASRLDPLIEANMPWRFTAKETYAYVALRNGEREKAKAFFQEIVQDPEAPPSLAARVSDILHAWD
ncbi:MAG: tetratricopeptide repeat protein [Alphaproteobacteria bacterium]|nr:tetratricopeptide repeat protein [Alphaproteobacteria bacterium]